MSNTTDSKKGLEHPDFEELLKAEQSRLSASKQQAHPTINASPKQEESEENSGLDDFDHFDLDEDLEKSLETKSDKKKEVKKDDLSNPEFGEVVVPGSEMESEEGTLDDSMQFNFDDASTPEAGEKEVSNASTQKPSVKKSSNTFLYVIIGIVVVAGAVAWYAFKHHQSAAPSAQATQQSTGFKPVLPTVHQLPQDLPPAVPQTMAPITTSVMASPDSNDQVLSSSANAPGGVSVVQVNRQELLGLLSNFQKVVKDSSKSISDQVSGLKTSLNDMSQSSQTTSSAVSTKLEQINSEMKSVDGKLDEYNKSISSVQTVLEKTQQQLKLILAQRAEDITHYTLRAVVPGRAWLVDGEGRTITIVQGQELKDYGTVEEINDKLGVVTMSSGFVFK
jgi:hypothetical protein